MEVERFKKEGLTAAQVKELTDKLLDVAGDRIGGTGAETLLKTLNKQAKNTQWILKKKANAEKLIDFVGDVYALSLSDAPPDPVEAYKALGKGVELSADLAEKIPGLKILAVPMLEAYSQAIKNGEGHIESIARATKAKNDIIDDPYMSPEYREYLAMQDVAEIKDYKPTMEEIQEQNKIAVRQEEYSQYLKVCSEEYNDYDRVSIRRAQLRNGLEEKRTNLDKEKTQIKNMVPDINIHDEIGNHFGVIQEGDVMVALETLEHIPERSVVRIVERIAESKPRLFICSVPVEVGPVVWVKNIGSFIMGYTRHKEYTWRETFWAGLGKLDKMPPHWRGHKGFDWRWLAQTIRHNLGVVEIRKFPLGVLPAWLSTSVFLLPGPGND